MTPTIASLRIGRGITASENSIDTLLAQLGNLVSEMAKARIETNVAAVTGQRALTRLAAAQMKLIEVRADVVRAHEDLRRIAESADFPTDCPEETFVGAELDQDVQLAA
jgi:hypothetical protein